MGFLAIYKIPGGDNIDRYPLREILL